MYLRRWTIAALECYKRGCICEGCFYNGFFDSLKRCRMKSTVIELVKKLGKPKDIKEKTVLER